MRDGKAYREFERALIRSTRPDVLRNLRLVGAMYEEARRLGVLPPEDRMEGIEKAIRIARVVNLVRGDSRQDSR